jgi:uncharacterized protein YrzB (UPF0473 family)
MNKNSQIILQDEAGKELEVDILFTFESKVNNKTYIVYTDHSTDSDGQEKVFAGIYDKNDEILNPIEDKDDYILIENILSSIDSKK